MKNHNKFSKSLLSLAIASSMTMAVSVSSHAAQEEEVEKITVTGSRIARTELASSSPITVVTKVEMDRLGITDVGEALRKLPALTGNTANSQSDSGNGSVATVTLRGIESSNTLVLINGRRTIAANTDNQVDLLSIPFEAVEQVQVLKDGASAIYGSDAIAGVVNIITKKDFDGVRVNASTGISQEGDGAERRLGITMGASGDKGNIMFSANVNNTDGWLSKDRNRTHDADFRHAGGQNMRSGTAPNARLSGFGLGDGTWTVLDANNPSEVVPYDGETMAYNYHNVTSGSNTIKNTTMFLYGEYDLTDEIQVYGEISSFQGWNQGNQAPPGTDTGWYGGGNETNAFHKYDENGKQYGVGANQYYNPFGKVGNVSRRFVEYGPRIYTRETDITRYTFGLKGELNDYDWEVLYASQDGRLTTDGGLQPSLMRIDAALSDECGTEADPNCVPLNVFGPPGSITQDMLDYINVTKPFVINDNSLDYIQAHIGGPIMELPGGDLSFAVGYEHREEQASQRADISQQTETFDVSWGEASPDVVSPVRKIDEVYAEFVFPVLEDLEFQAAVRHSEYSDLDTTTTNPKFGVIWQPTDKLKIRGSYSTGFRAPTMLQMYSGRASNFTEGITDPCDPTGTGVVANLPGCAGLEDGLIENTVKGFNVESGGSRDLRPEEATNLTVGMTFEPMDKLSFTLDYFRIEQSDVVFQSPEFVLDQAYVKQNPDYLSAVTRAEGGKGYIVAVNAPNNNIAERTVDGIDFAAMYTLDSSIGLWNFNFELSHFLTFEYKASPVAENFEDGKGMYTSAFGNIPENRANFTTAWQGETFNATYNMEYISATTEEGNGHEMGATNMHHVQVGYLYEDLGMDINFGVKNLFDKEPPLRFGGTNGVDFNTYSLRGRFFYLSLSKEF